MKFAVIGLGQFGTQLTRELVGLGHEVIAVDRAEREVDAIKDLVDFAAITDASDRKALAQLGLENLDAVIVAIGEDFAASLLITAHLQEIGVKRILCRVLHYTHERILGLMGITELIQAEALAARQLAKRLGIRGATRHFALTEDHAIVELEVPPSIIGKTLAESDLRYRHAVNLVTVRRQEGGEAKILGVPSPSLLFKAGDTLVIFGTESAIKAFSLIKKA